MIVAILAIVILAALLAYREHVHAKERAELLDRIQVPEVAVQRVIYDQVEAPEPIPADMGPWATPPEDDE